MTPTLEPMWPWLKAAGTLPRDYAGFARLWWVIGLAMRVEACNRVIAGGVPAETPTRRKRVVRDGSSPKRRSTRVKP